MSATCNPADRKPPPKAFGFDGSGQLLPFYTGVVTGLQARGVLTPEVARSAKFGGLSGGSIVSVLAAAGWSGADMFAVYLQAGAAIKKCVIDVVTASGGTVTQAQAALQCTLVDVGVPILRTALEARNPDLISVINGRVDIWACQVNALGTTLANSVAQGTNKVRGERGGRWGGRRSHRDLVQLISLLPFTVDLHRRHHRQHCCLGVHSLQHGACASRWEGGGGGSCVFFCFFFSAVGIHRAPPPTPRSAASTPSSATAR